MRFSIPTKMFTLLLVVIAISCNSGPNTVFKSKSDSLSFAKAFFDRYPDENSVRVKYRSADSVIAKGVQPISWKVVEQYQQSYDKHPLIYGLDGLPLQGYLIDSAGYSMITQNRNIKGLYLRFGKKADSAVTIMILGTDIRGNIIRDTILSYPESGNSGDFDNIGPCPTVCPKIQ